MVIPHKPEHALTLLQTRMFWDLLLAVRLFLVMAQRVPGLRQADAKEKNITLLKLDIALLGNGQDVIQRRDMLTEPVDLDALLLSPG